MPRPEFDIQDDDFTRLLDTLDSMGADIEKSINDVMHDKTAGAGPIIYRHINPLIHASGRKWKGKKSSAKTSSWPYYFTDQNLTVTVTTATKYNYLYFPDDGSNTIHHVGNQNFVGRGLESASKDVTDLIIQRAFANLEL